MVEILAPSPRAAVGRRGMAALLVALVSGAVYSATLGYDLVWDDTLLIQESWRLHHWGQLPSLLVSQFWAEVGQASQYYRPLVTLSFFFDLQIWGLRPLGFHLTNVLAHVAVTLAVLAVARRLMADAVAATISALIFAVHPLHAESVSFVSGRTDILATAFFLLALLAYDRGRGEGRWGWISWSLVAYLLALLAKEVALALPAVLVVWDWLARRDLRSWRAASRAAVHYAAYAAVTCLYLTLRGFALGGVVGPGQSVDAWAQPSARALTIVEILASYVRVTILPYPPHPFYAVVPAGFPLDLAWWLAAVGLVCALGATAWAVRAVPTPGLGALWFWLTLVPSVAVNLLPLPTALMAERFLYLPTVGFCLIVGWVAARLLGPVALGRAAQLPAAPAVSLAVAMLAYAVLTLWRDEDWRDEYRLYSRMVEVAPNAALAHINLAFVQLPRGEVAAASDHFREAVRLAPESARAYAGLGLTETILGDREAGLRNGRKARVLAPGDPDVLASLGALYLHRGEPTLAVPELTESLRLKPKQVHAALNRALALAWLGDDAAAAAQLEQALALVRLMSPDLPLADRITAEVVAARDPARARVAWERYTTKLQMTGQLSPALAAELAGVERRLGTAPGPR